MSVRHRLDKHSGYEAARSGAAFFISPDPGYLRISGEDRLDFIQRQTTNDIKALAPNQVQMTVLTSSTARIQDVFYLFMDDDDSVGVITLPGYTGRTLEFLKKRIFFRDRVSVTDRSHEFMQVDFNGPLVPQALFKIGIECPSEADELIEGELNGARLRIFRKSGLTQSSYRLLIPSEQEPDLINVLTAAGVVRLTGEDFEILRVEMGIPAAGKELSEEYTPLEVNLEQAISKEKGCYTGQEVIARQINYDKITKRMVGLHLEASVSSSARVQVDGKPAGEVASVVQSPRFGKIALAVLKRPYFEPETVVEIIDGDDRVTGHVCHLPFSESAESYKTSSRLSEDESNLKIN